MELVPSGSFWLLVGFGIIAGLLTADRCVRLWGLDPDVIHSMLPWALIPGFVGSHLVALGLYHPETIQADPWSLVRFWSHMSSVGGILGGTLGIWVFLRRRKVPLWSYVDAMAVGFTVAWIFGRIGCTITFDHPGLETDFFLAMPYPEGRGLSAGLRHNLGLYEVFWAVGLTVFYLIGIRRRRPAGWHLAIFGVAYCPFRFLLDFMRAADATYLGLTAAQYVLVPGFVACVWLLLRIRRA